MACTSRNFSGFSYREEQTLIDAGIFKTSCISKKLNMKNQFTLFLITALFLPAWGLSQQGDTLIRKLDSLSIKSDSLKNGQNNNINQKAYNENTRLDFKTYFLLLGNDFKQQLTLPFHIKANDWTKVAKFGILSAGVSFVDEPISRQAVNFRNSNKTVASASKFITKFGGLYEAYTLGALACYGFIFKNEKIKTTVYLASQAYITAAAAEIIFKVLSVRQRPYFIDPQTNENEPTFLGPLHNFEKQRIYKSSSSFPSGHTTVAFAAATVFAMEYRDRPLIPILSYSAATLIGLSRLTENKHWPTDILAGAALGFLSGKQVVNNYHRYAKIKQSTRHTKKSLSFTFRAFYGKLLPGFTYSL